MPAPARASHSTGLVNAPAFVWDSHIIALQRASLTLRSAMNRGRERRGRDEKDSFAATGNLRRFRLRNETNDPFHANLPRRLGRRIGCALPATSTAADGVC